MFSALLSVALLLHSASAQGTTSSLTNVTNAFTSSKIVPNVITTFNPTALLNISFTDNVTMESVNALPGTLLSMEQTATEPIFFLSAGSAALPSNAFVLVIVDPDAPTPQMPTAADFLHFVGGNFTANSTSGQLINSSAALVEFFPPTPPAGSDPHRYVTLVYNQPANFNINGPKLVNATTPRPSFNLSDFVQATNLRDPIAGDYFLVGPSNTSNTSAPATQTSIAPTASMTSHGSSNKFYKTIFPAVEAAFCFTIVPVLLAIYV